jgi:hypothetical protein
LLERLSWAEGADGTTGGTTSRDFPRHEHEPPEEEEQMSNPDPKRERLAKLEAMAREQDREHEERHLAERSSTRCWTRTECRSTGIPFAP